MAIKVFIGTPSSGAGSGDMTKSVYDPQNINSDAFDRSNHTGLQAISTITNLQTELDGKEDGITGGTTAQYWRGDKTFQTLDKNTVGLGNVENESQRTIRVFKTEKTTAFTPDVGSDRAWYPCNFATDQDITLNIDTVTEDGEVVYFKQTGVGIATAIEGTATIEFNASGVSATTGQNDTMTFIKNGSIYIQL